ncbi:MAG TPA: DUF1614 domain-containing protein [Stellaceae bacterium]|nr:DUF1614 domain-containing protein [Stellaceae bacterium]
MHFTHLHYLPLALPFFSILVGIFLIVAVLLYLGTLRYAYMHLGVSRGTALLVLLASLIGSYFNIPVADLPQRRIVEVPEISFYGVEYAVPVIVQWSGTVIAVNVGGALIPAVMSFYLLIKNRLWIRGVLATAGVGAVCHQLAHLVPGLGIALPVFVPGLTAAAVSLLLAWRRAAPLAYVSGSLGTLIGADLLNLDRVRGLGAPVASIGGAGTFDGIFLTGILAVLIASLFEPTDRSGSHPLSSAGGRWPA